jgi:predicted nucleic acid-binding protein
MSNSSTICPDASIVVRLLLNYEPGADIVTLWKEWRAAGYSFIAPTLLFYEISNVMHQYARQGYLSSEEVKTGFLLAFRLNIKTVEDVFLQRRAVDIAQQWQLPATYDAHYLAVAERYNACFFTTDRQLVSRVQSDLAWVRLWDQ